MSTTDLSPRELTPDDEAARAARHGHRQTKRHIRPATIVIGTVLALGAFLTAFPFLWMLVSAFKPFSEAIAYPPHLLPEEPTFKYLAKLFQELDFGRYLLNTLALVAISMVGLLAMAMAGYGFAKFQFRGREVLFFLVLMTMMIPVQVTMIPTFLIINAANLTDTLIGIALPTLVTGFSVFLFRQFMTTIPNEILEAARLDGAGEMLVFWRIVMPMSKPILAVQVVLTFIASWNSFLWPLILASDERNYTLSVGVALLNQQIATNPALQMAGAAVMVVPILVVFIVFQRYVVQGFALSGLK